MEEQSKKVVEFLKEIEEVSKKHGLSLGHEDYHGTFTVEEYSEYNTQWLQQAFDHSDHE